MSEIARTLCAAALNGALLGIPIAALVWLILKIVPRRSLNAATRYAIWWACLVVVAALPATYLLPRLPISQEIAAATEAWVSPSKPEPASFEVGATQLSASTEPVPQVSFAPARFPVELPAGTWPLAISALWAATALALLLRLAMSYALLERRKAQAVAAPDRLTARLPAWRAACDVRRAVRLGVSLDVPTPLAAGLARPSILIPVRLLDQLSDAELDQIGLHETAHLARFDDVALLAQRVLEAVFAFHPAVRWIARRIDLEREIACDNFVVRATGSARPYAACLTRVVELSGGVRGSLVAAAAVSEEGSHLAQRVGMLLDPRRNSGTRILLPRLAAVVVGLLLVGAAASRFPGLIAFAQDPEPPQPPAPLISAPPAPPAPPAPEIAPRPPRALAPRALAPRASFAIAAAPAPPAPEPPPAPPAPQSTSIRSDGSSVDYRWRDGAASRDLRISGNIEFTDDESDIKSVSPGGWFSVEDSHGFASRGYRISADGTGQLTRRYMVDGHERPLDEEGRAWLRALLPEILRESAIDAPARVQRLLRRGGPDAVLAEIGRIRNSNARRRYVLELVPASKLNVDQYQTLLRQVRETPIDNDKAALLIALAPYTLNYHLRDHAFAAAATIRNSNDRRRVLIEFLDRDSSGANLASVARAAEDIQIDNDKAGVLLALVAQYRGADEVRRPFFRTAGTIRNANDRARVLMAVIGADGNRTETLAEALRTSSGIAIDNDRARVLIHAASYWKEDESLRREFFASASEIRNANDRARTLLALLGHGSLSEATLLGCVDATEGIQIDNDKMRVLLSVIQQSASKPSVRARVREAARKVRNNNEYRRLMEALDRTA
jgi:beta-lactamase regulating signal transducer with metallopeptidase domain